jgi:actin-related protein 6
MTTGELITPTVLILDNGAYNIKAGIAGIDWEPRWVKLPPAVIFNSRLMPIECSLTPLRDRESRRRSTWEMRSITVEIYQGSSTGGHSRRCLWRRPRVPRRPYSAWKAVRTDIQGMLVNWDAEKTIWDRLFSQDVMKVREKPSLCRTYTYVRSNHQRPLCW